MVFAQIRSFCPDGSLFAQHINPNPCSLLSCHTSLLGICMYYYYYYYSVYNTPQAHPQPKNPFHTLLTPTPHLY